MKPDLSHLYAPTPFWLDLLFITTTLVTLRLLYVAIRSVSVIGALRVLALSVTWLAVLALLAYKQFFQQLTAEPPRFLLAVGPPTLLISVFLISSKGRTWIRQLPLAALTFVHVVRVPVELTLYGLYVHQQIPRLMTFEGRNYDILAGLTSPVMAYFFVQQKQVFTRWLLLWNLLSLGLVLNIVIHAVVSSPLPFQQLAFDQPNVGVLKAPYVWLPGFIVPTVLFSHVAAIYRLLIINHRGTENTELFS